jgi:serine/threonine protein kinase
VAAIAPSQDPGAAVAITGGGLGYLVPTQVADNSLLPVDLISREGSIYGGPTANALASALAQFQADADSVDARGLVFDIGGSEAASGWPFAGLVYANLDRNYPAGRCALVSRMIAFLAWTQTNLGAQARTTAVAPLGALLVKKAIESMGLVECDGAEAYTTRYISAAGPGTSLWEDLASLYDPLQSAMRFRYDAQVDLDAYDGVVDGDYDAALVSNVSLVGSARSVPLLVRAVGCSASVVGAPAQVSLSTIRDIFLGRITRWQQVPGSTAVGDITVVLNMGGNPRGSGSLLGGAPNRAIYVALKAADASVQALVYSSATGAIVWPTDANHTVMAGDAVASSVASTPGAFGCDFVDALLKTGTLTVLDVDGRSVHDTLATAIPPAAPTGDAAFGFVVPSASGWPFAAWAFLVTPINDSDCRSAAAVNDWAWWIATTRDPNDGGAVTAATVANSTWGRILVLSSIYAQRCGGEPVFSQYACVNPDGPTVCSNRGTCSADNSGCTCDDGYRGSKACEAAASSDPDTGGDPTGGWVVGLAVGLPVGATALLVLLCVALLVVVLYVASYRRAKYLVARPFIIQSKDLSFSDVKLGEGAMGEVYRGKYKGTEVVIKTTKQSIVDDIGKTTFLNELGKCIVLRHPNVVLFMGATLKPPALVLEYMSLGSLYDLLGNELLPPLPFDLKMKIGVQTANGMRYLHGSGIIHGDLKSANILLDDKWNAKISDFGLSHIVNQNIVNHTNASSGHTALSAYWTAPEVLINPGAVSPESDVYSFAIVLWELLYQDRPYDRPSQVVAAMVVDKDERPPVRHVGDEVIISRDAGDLSATDECVAIIEQCWHRTPSERMTFLAIGEKLSMLAEMLRGSITANNSTSGRSSNNSASSSSSSTTFSLSNQHSRAQGRTQGHAFKERYALAAPVPWYGNNADGSDGLAMVVTDICNAGLLWEHTARGMRLAVQLHNEVARALLAAHGGYESVAFGLGRQDATHDEQTSVSNASQGLLLLTFGTMHAAVEFAVEFQQALLNVEWDDTLLQCPEAATVTADDEDGTVVFKGPRVRMGVHFDQARCWKDKLTGTRNYRGPGPDGAVEVTTRALPGQILLTQEALDKLESSTASATGARDQSYTVDPLHQSDGTCFYQVVPTALAQRATMHHPRNNAFGSHVHRNNDDDDDDDDNDRDQPVTVLGTASMCRWIINFNHVALRDKIGEGTTSEVFEARVRGYGDKELAVKRFLRQATTGESALLQIFEESANLSRLEHPNVLRFIGICIRPPNLCIVTEYMSKGSLKRVLEDVRAEKLPWVLRLTVFCDVLRGLDYLHRMGVLHRDLKSSNILIDDNYNACIGDLGFARVKQEGNTMTQCGTPAWTAPEVTAGQEYNEKAEIYSTAIIMWEILTRRVPYHNLNPIQTALDVCRGTRPAVPADCPADYRGLMASAWHRKPSKRPSADEMLRQVKTMLQDLGADYSPV